MKIQTAMAIQTAYIDRTDENKDDDGNNVVYDCL